MKKKKAGGSKMATGSKSGGGKSGWKWLWLTFFVIAADLLTKSMASYYLSPVNAFFPKTILPFFNLVLVHNTGSAFGFLSGENGWQLWFFIGVTLCVAIGILAWLWRPNSKHALTASALSLILGGALGNLFDRVMYGYVVDFLDFHYDHYHWPAFNVADSAICLGVFLLILSAFRKA